MLEGKTRIPPVDVETLPDDLRETLEEQRQLRGAPLYPYRSAARARRRPHPLMAGFVSPVPYTSSKKLLLDRVCSTRGKRLNKSLNRGAWCARSHASLSFQLP